MRGALVALLCLTLTRLATAEIAVTDDTGATVRLPAPARHIVTLAPHATELVFAAGAGAALVATVEHSDEPEAARHVARLGGLAGIDRERLLVARPDLVVAWASGNPPGLLAWLERRGIPVYRSEPARLADINRSVAALATLAGLPPPAPPGAAPAAKPTAPVTALFLFWDDPPIAAGDTHVLSDVLRGCGATPAIAGLRGKSVVLSREALLAARPDLVFVTDGRLLTSNRAAGSATHLAELPLTARQQEALATAQRPGPRLHRAAAVVCEHTRAVAASRQ